MKIFFKMNLPEFPVHVMGDGTYWFTPGEYFEWLCQENSAKEQKEMK